MLVCIEYQECCKLCHHEPRVENSTKQRQKQPKTSTTTKAKKKHMLFSANIPTSCFCHFMAVRFFCFFFQPFPTSYFMALQRS